MFRVIEIGPEGLPIVDEGTERVGPPPAGVIRWIDVQNQDAEQLELLRERFGFHPLAIEDCLHFDQRPKLEGYGGYQFIVTHGIVPPKDGENELRLKELHAFLADDYLVTVHQEPIEVLATVQARVLGDEVLAHRGAVFIYYLIADGIVDRTFPVLDQLADALDEIEDAVLDHTDAADLHRMFRLKRLLVAMRKVLSPQRDVFGLLAKRGGGPNQERINVYFRDVYDHLVRINESIEATRDLLGNALDAYLTSVSNRTNEIMKRLTLVSVIFLPLTFITGFFGQNFEHLPFKSVVFLWLMVVSCIAVPTGMLFWFRKNRWI